MKVDTAGRLANCIYGYVYAGHYRCTIESSPLVHPVQNGQICLERFHVNPFQMHRGFCKAYL